MNSHNIKDYINKALALEKAIFIQEELIKEHTKLLDNKRKSLEKALPSLPRKPLKRTVKEPYVERNWEKSNTYIEKPSPPTKPVLDDYSRVVGFLCRFGWIVSLLSALIILMRGIHRLCFFEYDYLTGWIERDADKNSIIAGIILLFVSLFLMKITRDVFQPYKDACKKYLIKISNFEAEKEQYYLDVEKAKLAFKDEIIEQEKHAAKEYEKAKHEANIEYEKHLVAYNENIIKYDIAKKKLDEFKKSSTSILRDQSKLLNMLKSALKEHYSSNILYPKYQYFVPVASIYEYLSSGRCDSLEGANGAYNLYETELRQNLIINQLSSLLGNIEQAKYNQYLLYKELMDAREIVRRISVSISSLPEDKNTTLNSYISSTLNLIDS